MDDSQTHPLLLLSEGIGALDCMDDIRSLPRCRPVTKFWLMDMQRSDVFNFWSVPFKGEPGPSPLWCSLDGWDACPLVRHLGSYG